MSYVLIRASVEEFARRTKLQKNRLEGLKWQKNLLVEGLKWQKNLLEDKIARLAERKSSNLTWSWRVLVKGHRSWNLSIEDSIRRRIIVGFSSQVERVLALVDRLHPVSYCFIVLYGLVVF